MLINGDWVDANSGDTFHVYNPATGEVMDAALPFGGYKESGWGREMGSEVFELYTQVKAVCVRT